MRTRLPPCLLTAALLAGLFCGCAGSAAAADKQAALLGSTSMERVVGILAEQFSLDHPDTAVSVEGGGSGAGAAAVASGLADIGMSSRGLTESELETLDGTLLALDGVAVAVHEDNPVDGLTLEQLAALFTGELTDWAQVGGAPGPVACVGREAGSGTREGFESVTGTAGRCVLAQELTSSGAVVEAVRGNPQAIGYASLSAVEGQAGVRIVAIDGTVCSEQAILDGSYPLQRPFLLVTRRDAALSPTARAFFDWALSPDAAELIRRAGAVPLTDEDSVPQKRNR